MFSKKTDIKMAHITALIFGLAKLMKVKPKDLLEAAMEETDKAEYIDGMTKEVMKL